MEPRDWPTKAEAQDGNADLKFVNLSHPEDIRRHRQVQREIRQHVMRAVGNPRRRRALQDPRPRSGSTSQHVSPETTPENASTRGAASPVTAPLSKSLPSLGSFPIEANMRVLELVHFGMTRASQAIAQYVANGCKS